MVLIDINEALQAVDNRIKELNTHKVFRKKADSIDVLGVKKWINNISPIEAIPKADYDELKASIAMMRLDYEARLKADMVAMLTEIQLEIEEIDSRAGYDGNGMPTFSTDYIRKNKVNELIQQKINSLKEK